MRHSLKLHIAKGLLAARTTPKEVVQQVREGSVVAGGEGLTKTGLAMGAQNKVPGRWQGATGRPTHHLRQRHGLPSLHTTQCSLRAQSQQR